MESRIMQVFYGVDCLPYKDSARKVHYPIVGNSFLGANNTTEIRFYVRDIGGVNNVSWVAVSKLPNGKVGSEVLSTIQFDSELNEYYVVLNLSSYYTQMKGDVYISLNGYQGEIQVSQNAETGIYTIEGTPIIEATGSIKLSINYAPQVPQGQHFNISDLQQILGAISEKANVFSTIQIISDITQEDLSGYQDGQLFYDTYYNTYYQKNSLNETYGYVKAENGLLANQHTILRLSGSEYGSFGTVKEIVHDRMFIFNYNSKDYLVSLNYGSFASGNNGVASALDLLSRQYYYRNDLTSSDNLSVLFQSQYETTYVDKAYVDNAIVTIKRNAFISVNTTTYPTLQSFLNSTGEEGYIYLYPLDSQDLSKGYYQYTYENNAWLYLGETNLDLSGYATKEELEDYSTTSESQAYTQNYVSTTLQSYDLTIKSWVNGKDYATNSQLNHNVHVEVQQHEFTFNGNTVTYTCSYVNLKTGTTGTRQENIPLANSTTAGMMSSSDYNQIRSNTDRISALEGRQFRLSYTASSTPTATDIKNFVNTYLASVGITNPTDSDYYSISVVVEATKHIWNYYVNDHTYKDDGLDSVSIFTNNVAGIILGTDDDTNHTNDGKVYAENDGTGSVLGFDRLSTRVYNLENAGFITASVSNLQNYYDKTYIDTYIATKTWVGQQGYLTSLPSNVAYKDINNNFSRQQTFNPSHTGTPLIVGHSFSSSQDTYIEFQQNNTEIGWLQATQGQRLGWFDGTSTKRFAYVDDTLKNAYHLGAFDTVDTSNSGYDLITRRTGYFTINTNNITQKGGDSNGSGNAYFLTDLTIIFNGTWNASVGVSNIGYDVRDIDGTWVRPDMIGMRNNTVVIGMASGTTLEQVRALCPIKVEYELETAYPPEKVIKNQPLNTLDKNGSEWLRNEWESQLNLLPSDTIWLNHYKIDESTGVMSDGAWYQEYNATQDYISIQPNTTYSFSCLGGTPTRLYFFYYNANKTFISSAYADNTFTLTTPSNVAYIRIETYGSGNQGVVSNCMLNKGDHPYPYVPYDKFKGFLKEEYKNTLNLFTTDNYLYSRAVNVNYGFDGSTINFYNINLGGNDPLSYQQFGGLEKGKTYTITITPNQILQYWTVNGANLGRNYTYTFVASDETFELGFEFAVNSYTTCSANVMLVEGDTPQPYEDYNGKIIHEKDLETFESGENLFDINNPSGKDGGITYSISGNTLTITSTSYWHNLKYAVKVKPNTTYTLHLNQSYSAFVYIYDNTNNTQIYGDGSTPQSDYTITFTTPSNCNEIRLQFYDQNGTTNTITNIMLNKGSTPKPFKEYVGAIVRESTLPKYYRHNITIDLHTSNYSSFVIITNIIVRKSTQYTGWSDLYQDLYNDIMVTVTNPNQYVATFIHDITSSSFIRGNVSETITSTNSITDVVTEL